MSQVSTNLCGDHSTLSPSCQGPLTLISASNGCGYAHGDGAAFRLGRHVQSPITLQYIQRNYHVIKDASLVLALGYFDRLRKHVLGGTGWVVVMAQMLHKPLYVFDVAMEQWYWWNPTLENYQPCEGMTETPICNPTLQDHTAIVGTREQASVIYPTLDNLFNNNHSKAV